jgi:membrane protease YdiL (CAAX protease family)
MSSPSVVAPNSADLRPIAPLWHTGVMVAILAAPLALSMGLRMESTHKMSHLPSYAIAIAFEWAAFAFSLWRSDAAFVRYVAGVLRKRSALLLDFPVALLLAAILLSISPLIVRLLGHTGWFSTQGMLPKGGLEVAVWIAMAFSAAICEETVFRGYFQQQISGWTQQTALGILGQAVVFGLSHGYQGWKNMVLISIWGCIFGVFAWWRGGLRANMIAHAALDGLAAF